MQRGTDPNRVCLDRSAVAGTSVVDQRCLLLCCQGVVDLVLRCAALADPHSLAWRLGSSGNTAAARAARDRCYSHLLEVLRPLLGVGPPPKAAPVGAAAAAAGASGAGAGAVEEASLLTPAESGAAKEAMMQVRGGEVLRLLLCTNTGCTISDFDQRLCWCSVASSASQVALGHIAQHVTDQGMEAANSTLHGCQLPP